MSIQAKFAVGALLAAALTAHAGQPARTLDPADPADPSAPVPGIVYVSALADSAPAPTTAPTPDKLWRAANDQVGAQSNHAMHHQHVPAPESRREAAPAPAGPAAAQDQNKQNQQNQHH